MRRADADYLLTRRPTQLSPDTLIDECWSPAVVGDDAVQVVMTELRKAFGDDVIDHYVHAAHWEQTEYDRRVTDWEVRRCFERT